MIFVVASIMCDSKDHRTTKRHRWHWGSQVVSMPTMSSHFTSDRWCRYLTVLKLFVLFLVQSVCDVWRFFWKLLFILGICYASRLHLNLNRPVWFNSKVVGNFRIDCACPLLVVVKGLASLTALSGTVYRLASSMSDRTLVLFNVFEDWNEKSVVLHISFVSFVINRLLQNARFDSYSVGPLWNILNPIHTGQLQSPFPATVVYSLHW